LRGFLRKRAKAERGVNTPEEWGGLSAYQVLQNSTKETKQKEKNDPEDRRGQVPRGIQVGNDRQYHPGENTEKKPRQGLRELRILKSPRGETSKLKRKSQSPLQKDNSTRKRTLP